MESGAVALGLLLRLAHASECGAARAYAGHARSLPDGPERRAVFAVLRDELRHRRQVRGLLAARGRRPWIWADALLAIAGASLGWACFWTGRRLPHAGAALAEAVNVVTYRLAGQVARWSDDGEAVSACRVLAEAESRHVDWFAHAALVCRPAPPTEDLGECRFPVDAAGDPGR